MTKRSLSEQYRASGTGSAVRIYPEFRPVFSCHPAKVICVALTSIVRRPPNDRPVTLNVVGFAACLAASGRN